jgi:tetratricopeptide (TPR) repeat protein
MKKIILALSLVVLLIGCRSVSKPKRAIQDSGMMYAMIYDYENTPVYGVAVFIDKKKYTESDLQGRFVLEFKKNGKYTIRLEKSGYELIEDTFTYDPMNVLYFKMVNASQLVSQAEEAMEQYAYKGAEELINRALILEPNRPDVLYFQSIVLYYQGRKAEARVILENLQSRGIDGDYIKDFLNKLSD